MTDYAWPDDLVPYAVSFYLQPHTGGSESPFNRATKVYGLSAPRWMCRLQLRGGYSSAWGDSAAARAGARLDGFIAKLKGRQNRVSLYDFRRPTPWSDLPGTASNSAALAGATSVILTGLTPGAAVYGGDYIGGDGRPHIILDDVTVAGDGTATVDFEPAFLRDVATGEVTFENVAGKFRLTSDDAGDNPTEVGELSNYTLEFVEDFPVDTGDLLYGVSIPDNGGAVYDLSRWATTLFQEAAATTPVTAAGQLVGCIKNVLGNADFDLIADDNADRPTFRIENGLPYIECAANKGLYTRADINARTTIPLYQLMVWEPVATPSIVGFIGYAGSFIYMGSGTFGNTGSWTERTLAPTRSAVRPEGVYYGAHPGQVTVADLLMTAGEASMWQMGAEASTAGLSPKVTAWANGDVVSTHLRYALNVSTLDPFDSYRGVPSATHATNFYGGLLLLRGPTEDERQTLTAYFMDQVGPDITAADEVILIIGDSTSDDVDTATAAALPELFESWADANKATLWPNKTVLYRNHASYGGSEAVTGYKVMQTGTDPDKVYIINSSVSGSEPNHFMASRFELFEAIDHVDRVIWNHGHNLPTTDTTGWQRVGNYMAPMDQVRSLFPDAYHMMLRVHPRQSDTLIDGVVAAIDKIATAYGDVELVNIHDPWVAAGKPAARYWDGVHLTLSGAGNGLTAQRTIFDPAYAAWAPAGTPALPRLGTTVAGLLANERFSNFTGALPASWSALGAATVERSTAVVDEGDSSSVFISGNSTGIQQSISAVPYQGGHVTLAVRVYGDSGFGDGVRLFTNGTGLIVTDETSLKAHGRWRWVYATVPVPADATTITVELAGGLGGAGSAYFGRAILVSGQVPKDVS